MGRTKIEWAHYTFNPWIGCQKVSDGCKFCYAERDFTRKPQWKNTWGPPAVSERIRTSVVNWNKPMAWNRQARKTGEPVRVFCASLGDVFEDHPTLPPWRESLFQLIEATESLTWLLLTKRPENVLKMTENAWPGRLPENVWIGTSIENQAAAEIRIPSLLKVRAQVHFLSCEPLLSPVKINNFIRLDRWTTLPPIDWVIVGGESGPQARPIHPDWVRELRDQCQQARVAFFFKQWGEWGPVHDLAANDPGVKGKPWVIYDPENSVCRIGKERAGRHLDGEIWEQFPH